MDAAAEAIGYLVLAQHGGGAFDVALVGSGENDARFGGHEVSELFDERGNRAVKAQGWP